MNPENRRAKVSRWPTALKRIGWLIGVIIVGALLALLAGCVTKAPRGVQLVEQPPMPPMPVASVLGDSIVEAPPEAAVTLPVSITIAWNASPDSNMVAHYNVYASTTPFLRDMVQIGETTNLWWYDPADLPMRFFQVTAHGTNGLESGWATK